MKKFAISLLCAFLCLTTTLATFPVAAESQKLYVQDITVVTTDDDDEDDKKAAIKKLTDDGWEVIPRNLNAGTDEGYAFIGYKTTKNKHEALADIRMMEMDGGYVRSTYASAEKSLSITLNALKSNIKDGIKEVKANYYAGSPAAKYAIKALNRIQNPDLKNMGLGDAILSDNLGDKHIEEIIKFCPNYLLSSIEGLILTGCSDYDAKYKRPANLPEDKIDAPYSWLHRTTEISSNADDYAISFYDEVEYFAESIERTGVKLNEAKEKPSEELTDMDKLVLTANEIMNSFIMKDSLSDDEFSDDEFSDDEFSDDEPSQADEDDNETGVGVGDLVWDWTNSNSFTPERCYPLYSGMTPGQRGLVAICGIEFFVGCLNNTNEMYDKLIANLDVNKISVFQGIDRKAAKNDVYVTDKGAKLLSAKNDLQALTNSEAVDEEIKRLWAGIGVIGGVYGLALVGSGLYSFVTGMSAATAIASGLASGFLANAAAWCGVISSALGYVTLILTVALAIAWLIVKLVEYIKEKYPDKTPIPPVLYDGVTGLNGKNAFARYEHVGQPDGSTADLNCDEGRKWNALYKSRDSRTGTPILADFLVEFENGITPSEYHPLRMFGRKSAADLNLNIDNDVNGIYVFFKRDGAMPETDSQYKYIASLELLHEKSKNVLLNKVEDMENYNLVNYNLTPGDGYTYLAYSTIDDEDDAIKDIRVAYGLNLKLSTSSFTIGNSSYSLAGTYGNIGIVYTAEYDRGDPITTGSIYISGSSKPPEKYYEPVCHVSGGPAFNLNLGANKTPVYMFFKPSVINDDHILYVSGIAQINEYTTKLVNNGVMNVSSSVGGGLPPVQLLTASDYMIPNDAHFTTKFGSTYFGVTTTTNYKRALKEIIIFNENRNVPQIATQGQIYQKAPNLTTWYEYNTASKKVLKDKTANVNLRIGNDLIYDSGIYVSPASYDYDKETNKKIVKVHAITYKDFAISSSSSNQTGKKFAAKIFEWNKAASIGNNLHIYYNGSTINVGKYIKSIAIGKATEKQGKGVAKANLVSEGADAYVGSIKAEYDGDDYFIQVGTVRSNTNYEAITDIKLVTMGANATPDSQIKFGVDVIYTLNSRTPIAYLEEKYPVYVYTTRNPGAGSRITSISWAMEPPLNGTEILEYVDVKGNDAMNEEPDYFFEVYRENPVKYVTEIGIFYDSWKFTDNDRDNIVGSGITKYHTNLIERDLNNNAGGSYMYLTYRKSLSAEKAITGVIARIFDDADDAPLWLFVNGICYIKSCKGKCPDLNRHAGGDYIYLYETCDKRAGGPIIDFKVQVEEFDDMKLTKGYHWVGKVPGERLDMNKTAGGDDVFISFKREYEADSNLTASIFNEITPVGIFVICISSTMIVGVFTYSFIRKRKRKNNV